MNRQVIYVADYLLERAVDKLNSYCCNTDNVPIQIEVINKPGLSMIVAIVEKQTLNNK